MEYFHFQKVGKKLPIVPAIKNNLTLTNRHCCCYKPIQLNLDLDLIINAAKAADLDPKQSMSGIFKQGSVAIHTSKVVAFLTTLLTEESPDTGTFPDSDMHESHQLWANILLSYKAGAENCCTEPKLRLMAAFSS